MLTRQLSDPEMKSDEFLMFRDFIHEKSGIYFAENKAYLLKNRLARRMAQLGITGYRDYYYHVKYDASQREIAELMNLVTTTETSFFRNEPQLQAFSDEVLPLLTEQGLKGRGQPTLRVWSAGCATGEEPYTLAILLLESLPGVADWRLEIVANDISEQALRQARCGEYSGLTLRNLKPHLLYKYFTKSGDVYRIKPEIKALVRFSNINLNDSRQVSLYSNFDVIFCRNVMIYFSEEVKRRLVRGFFNSLRPGGYLYIGHSETLHGISKAFKLVYLRNALVYQKDTIGVLPVGSVRETASDPAQIAAGIDRRQDAAARASALLNSIKPENGNR